MIEHARCAMWVIVGGGDSIHCCQLMREQVDQRSLGGKDRVKEVGMLQAMGFGHQPHCLGIASKDGCASVQQLKAAFDGIN